ncbi:MAG: DUF5906 domain-containing protein [Candidatus Acidiferrum sp.]
MTDLDSLVAAILRGENFQVELRDPFIKTGEQGEVVFCREPRDPSERQLQLRILANHCQDPKTLVPPEMLALDRWICWKYFKDPDSGNWTKPPYSPKTGRKIGATPKYYGHLVAYSEAVEACKNLSMSGVGFVLVRSDGFVGVDFDDVVQSGVIRPEAQKWLAVFPSYQEFSPSGQGIHVLCKGAIAKAVKTDWAELYREDRYFTFSGMQISVEKSVQDCQDGINKLSEYLQTSATGSGPPPRASSSQPRDSRSISASTARNVYASMVEKFRAMVSPEDCQNDQLNACAFFAAKCFAAGVFEETEEEIKNKLREIAESTGYCPTVEKTLRSGWEKGITEPLVIAPESEWKKKLEATLAEMNKQFFVVQNFGSHARVAWLEPEAHPDLAGRIKLEHSSYNEFKNALIKETVCIGPDENGVMRYLPKATWWLMHNRGRIYWKVVFMPEREVQPNEFNLWTGFSVEAKEGDCSKYLWHIKHIICNGDEEHYAYTIRWMARAVQKPWERAHVALVWRGPKGPGKNLALDGFGELFGSHYLVITNAEHFVGRFNSHLRAKCIIGCNEAFFAGDKRHEGVLKGLITDPQMPIEAKFVDLQADVNLSHVILLSNLTWVIPTDEDERRFFMVDVSDSKIGDFKYFQAIRDELDHGGKGALLYHLKHVDISQFNPRLVPHHTKALRSQMSESLTGMDAAWFECLVSGEIPGHWEENGTVWMRGSEFTAWAAKKKRQWEGITTTKVSNVLGRDTRLKSRGMGFVKEQRMIAGSNTRVWLIPDLQEARKRWNERRFEHDWDGSDESWTCLPTLAAPF